MHSINSVWIWTDYCKPIHLLYLILFRQIQKRETTLRFIGMNQWLRFIFIMNGVVTSYCRKGRHSIINTVSRNRFTDIYRSDIKTPKSWKLHLYPPVLLVPYSLVQSGAAYALIHWYTCYKIFYIKILLRQFQCIELPSHHTNISGLIQNTYTIQ